MGALTQQTADNLEIVEAFQNWGQFEVNTAGWHPSWSCFCLHMWFPGAGSTDHRGLAWRLGRNAGYQAHPRPAASESRWQGFWGSSRCWLSSSLLFENSEYGAVQAVERTLALALCEAGSRWRNGLEQRCAQRIPVNGAGHSRPGGGCGQDTGESLMVMWPRVVWRGE